MGHHARRCLLQVEAAQGAGDDAPPLGRCGHAWEHRAPQHRNKQPTCVRCCLRERTTADRCARNVQYPHRRFQDPVQESRQAKKREVALAPLVCIGDAPVLSSGPSAGARRHKPKGTGRPSTEDADAPACAAPPLVSSASGEVSFGHSGSAGRGLNAHTGGRIMFWDGGRTTMQHEQVDHLTDHANEGQLGR